MNAATDIGGVCRDLGLDLAAVAGEGLRARSPVDGGELARLRADSKEDVARIVAAAHAAFLAWREWPAPKRGELVRLFGEELRGAKESLARLVTLESGKILEEARGEVQEMIDICDFALGLSRQLHGLTIASERPGHRMMETWHPMGPTAVISAFNFPVAVWAWNAALAWVCGNPVVWKPSEKAPLCALACRSLFERAVGKARGRLGDIPAGLGAVVLGAREQGEWLVDDARIRIVSATGSTAMGRALAQRTSTRFVRTILELGGNNAMIVAPSADLELAVRAITFSAVGTAGQRCTSLRRLIVHESLRAPLVERLGKVFASLPIGNPLDKGTLVGPLVDMPAFERMQEALRVARADGGAVLGGERVLAKEFPHAAYVRPALAAMPWQTAIVKHETFAPILYVLGYRDLEEAIALHNDVPQGLASSIFTNDLREAEHFLSASGSDCGIANVNIGPSGAEIGGAFGGEKDTGGGRESGSDAWKAYMRRATSTINFSGELPLAQGIRFDA
ncbi:MAG TPA: aldehyde dehydrogenase family protein [Usitatibacteraceae bacterium]|nr:aldehyde dehydrogenase family protein [Usitatibacteraceae bacterium]